MERIADIADGKANYVNNIKGSTANVKKTMGNNPRRITKIEIDFTFPKEYDSKTKTILQRVAHNCPVHHTLSEKVEKNPHKFMRVFWWT